MQQDPLLAQAGKALYQQYEKQRRTRLAFWFSISNTLSFVVFFFVDIIALIDGQQANTPGLPFVYITLAIFAGVSAMAIWFGRHGYATAAAICIVGPIFLAVTGFLITWVMAHGVDISAYLAATSYLVLIALAGLLGNLTLMFGTTALVVVVTLFATIIVPRMTAAHAVLLTGTQLSNILTVIALEGGFAMIMFFALSGYRRTLLELGDVRVQYDRAKALDDLKDQFITSVNHELRNPVMAMQGYLDILEMSIEHAPREKIEQLITKAVQAGDSLRDLLTSILDARRLDQGADDFTPAAVNVHAALEAAITMIDPLEAQAETRDLKVDIPAAIAIWGEKIRLQQILTNLLSNAIKYSPDGAPVEVTAQLVQEHEQMPGHFGRKTLREHPMVEVRVRDHGQGILPEQIPLLFQRFVRLPRDLASNVIGNGLGLFVCRALVEAMGGRIWAESSGVAGEGATFIMRLPSPPAAPDTTPPTANHDASLHRQRIPV